MRAGCAPRRAASCASRWLWKRPGPWRRSRHRRQRPAQSRATFSWYGRCLSRSCRCGRGSRRRGSTRATLDPLFRGRKTKLIKKPVHSALLYAQNPRPSHEGRLCAKYYTTKFQPTPHRGDFFSVYLEIILAFGSKPLQKRALCNVSSYKTRNWRLAKNASRL